MSQVARVIASRVKQYITDTNIQDQARLTFLDAKERLRRAITGLPPGLLLLRLPAQYVDHAAGRLARAGRHRLPRDGDVDLRRR